ncbi:hypothetical protein KC19_10G130700 [Ceratodon purpureus]|uniref:Uncharacterized protein n=1 Tax=Ceratodon purpureus TaxID=3225 RepID=A0A8T0GNJ9_CERPU|nr:hypothetical protein KC19_10G130700 [Ceratodon purpureus]
MEQYSYKGIRAIDKCVTCIDYTKVTQYCFSIEESKEIKSLRLQSNLMHSECVRIKVLEVDSPMGRKSTHIYVNLRNLDTRWNLSHLCHARSYTRLLEAGVLDKLKCGESTDSEESEIS